MDHFTYRDGVLHAEDVPLPLIADEVGTPFYVYAAATLRRHYRVFAEGFAGSGALVAFAVKALSNIAVLSLLGKEGAGADIVSGGELFRALKAGIPADRIVFSGVGKTRAEMKAALEAGILQFNVESEAELRQLAGVAEEMDVAAPLALRVNPDVDAGTDTRISTGRKNDKFGIPWDEAVRLYTEAAAHPSLAPRGIAMHIGSQITSLMPFEKAAGRGRDLVTALRGKGCEVASLDLGGGLGIPYRQDGEVPPLPSDYAAIIRRLTDDLGVQVIMEPGRLIAGNAGLFVTEVLLQKDQDGTQYVIVDGGMNDLMRPALYGSHHDVQEVAQSDAEPKSCHIAGPVCESTDVFLRDAALRDPKEGALLAFRGAGAYGATQSSQYNTRPLAPEVLVDGERFAIIRKRPSYEDMLSGEAVPSWL
ncbi:diaminopimelate decarboxylase [Parvularcula marina]|uniref:Diaminopimelate decarboxylase n=1 Tax=Parvularcula marina TaxID=2292771 RepID=A0A371RIF8_9PROT|nr:diaminopimelate decarboxylase [Parvularcula marina]RFB05239.1 diaminopimelate decarboxylase [Parvularcula marina]